MEKIVVITDKDQPDPAIQYWHAKTPAERIEALEFLRRQFMIANHVDERLQRVYKVVEQKQG
jgi:hypothetical protein